MTAYLILGFADPENAATLIRDMRRHPRGTVLTPSANPVHATLADLHVLAAEPAWAAHLHTHAHRTEHRMSEQQGAIDAITADLGTIRDSLDGVHAELATGIQNLEDELAAKGVSVDLTALKSARDALGTTRDDLQAQADAVPQPTPPPAP